MLAGMLLLAGPTLGFAEARTRLTQEEQVSVDLFKDNTPSVVFITNLAVRCAHLQACFAGAIECMLIPGGPLSHPHW